MSCGRETFDLFNKYGRQNFRRQMFSKYRSYAWELMWGDTFMRFPCMILGHDKYNAGDCGEIEMACKRCHNFIKDKI